MISSKIIVNHINKYPSEKAGIIWAISACFWFSIMGVLVKLISADVHPVQIVFFRNFFATILFLPWAFKFGFKNMIPKKWNLYIYRATSGQFGMVLFFYLMAKYPLPQVISLTFTVPLITSLLASLFLGEKISFKRWLTMMVGFSGVLIIVRPFSSDFDSLTLLTLVVAFGWSVSNIFVKKLTKTEDSKAIVFISTAITLPFLFVLSMFFWQTPNYEQLIWLIILAVVTNQAQFCLTQSFSLTQMNVVLPFDFFRLIFVTALSYLIFDQFIDIWTFIGAAIIFTSAIYVSRKNKTLLKS